MKIASKNRSIKSFYTRYYKPIQMLLRRQSQCSNNRGYLFKLHPCRKNNKVLMKLAAIVIHRSASKRNLTPYLSCCEQLHLSVCNERLSERASEHQRPNDPDAPNHTPNGIHHEAPLPITVSCTIYCLPSLSADANRAYYYPSTMPSSGRSVQQR